MSAIVCKKETSFRILLEIKKSGHIKLTSLESKTGLSNDHIRGNLKSYLNRGRVYLKKNGRTCEYFWNAGDSDVVLRTTHNKGKINSQCECGRPSYRNKSGASVCRVCDAIETKIYGNRITKFQQANRFFGDENRRKYITVYEMPANYRP